MRQAMILAMRQAVRQGARRLRRHLKCRDGFTLLELIVAFAIFSILLAVLYSTFAVSHRAVSAVDGTLLGLHEARSALDVMAREVESALLSNKGDTIEVLDRDAFGRQTSRLSFKTFSSPLPALARVEYFVDEDGEKLALMKRLAPGWAEDEGAGGVADKDNVADVVEDIEEFTVEVRLADDWVRVWPAGGHPEEIRITLTINSGGRKLPLTEIVRPRL